MNIADYVAMIRVDPSKVAEAANELTFADAIAATYHLRNEDRKALIDRYRAGLSTQPGFTYVRVDAHGRVDRGFIQGPIAVGDAEALAWGDRRWWRRVKLIRSGVWPSETRVTV